MFSLFGKLFGKKAVDAVRSIDIEQHELTDEDIAKMRDDDDCSDSAPIEGEVG